MDQKQQPEVNIEAWGETAGPQPSPVSVASYVNGPKRPLQDEVPFGHTTTLK